MRIKDIFGLFLGIFGILYILYNTIKAIYIYSVSVKWKKIDAIIITCSPESLPKITERYGVYGGQSISLKYKYNVDGKEYYGNKITPFDSLGRANIVIYPDLKEIIKKFEMGDHKIFVYCNTKNPKKSIIENRLSWLGVLANIFALAVGIIVILLALHHKNTN